MPAKETTGSSNTLYYSPQFIQYKNKRGFEVEQYAFTQYDKASKEVKYVSEKWGGHITKLTLGEEKNLTTKDGRAFTAQSLYVEFHEDGVKEVLDFSWGNTLARQLLSKLSRAQDFTKIDLLLGRSAITKDGKPALDQSGNPKYNDWLAVYESGNKLGHTVVGSLSQIDGDDVIKLPAIRYRSKNLANTTEDVSQAYIDPSTKKAMIDPLWRDEINSIYTSLYDSLVIRIEAQRGDIPQPINEEEAGIPVEDLNPDIEGMNMPF
jgi:hypothetical protein